MKKITILGSTGSIGTNALKVIEAKQDEFQVLAISGYSNLKLLQEQIARFTPQSICIGSEDEAKLFKELYPDKIVYFVDNGL